MYVYGTSATYMLSIHRLPFEPLSLAGYIEEASTTAPHGINDDFDVLSLGAHYIGESRNAYRASANNVNGCMHKSHALTIGLNGRRLVWKILIAAAVQPLRYASY